MTVWACVATGPSLTPEDVDALQGRVRVLCINDSYRLAPWADAIYAADLEWWHRHHSAAEPDFKDRMYSIESSHDPKNPRLGNQLFGLRVFKPEPNKNIRNIGLSRVPGVLRLGGLSGYQGINAAYQWGAKVLLLVGYDMQNTGGQRHWFGNHPRGLINASDYGKRIKHFETIRPDEYGMKIINCTRQTALNCFPRMTVHEALEKYA